MKKQIIKYIGRKIRKTYDMSVIHKDSIVEELNIVTDFEKYKNDIENEDYKIELLQDNIILYKCDIKNSNGNLAILSNIREKWAKGKFDYRNFYTKSEIKNFLDNDYLVAIEGLQEVNLENLDNLE